MFFFVEQQSTIDNIPFRPRTKLTAKELFNLIFCDIDLIIEGIIKLWHMPISLNNMKHLILHPWVIDIGFRLHSFLVQVA